MKETKQSVFIATSLDGFIARKDGDIGWLVDNSGQQKGTGGFGYQDFISSIDALVMGRNTFEKVLTFDEWPYKDKLIVLTHRPLEVPDELGEKVEIMSGFPQDIVTQLAEKGYYHLYVDGGKTIQQFLNAGLIQEMTITRIPILIGNGIPLFGPVIDDINLEHLHTSAFDNGFVQSRYKVAHES